MKKLVMSALVLGALSQAAGCIFVTDDGDETGSIDVAWTLADGGCADADTATINALLTGDSTPYKDIYNCSDGSGLTQDLPLGTYTVWVDMTNGSGGSLVAQSEAVDITLGTDGQLATADFAINVTNGYVDAGWTFSNGESCANYVGENGISVLSTEVGNGANAYDDVFDCEDGFGTTAEIPAFLDYTVVVSIIDGNGAVLGDAPAETITIDHGNEFVVLDVVIAP